MGIDIHLLEQDLRIALARRIGVRRRRRRFIIVGASVVAASFLSAAAIASGIGGELQLDPTKWTILGGGSVDDGRGAFVHAKRVTDGGHSTFLVEHDDGLSPYAAFLLHERTLGAAERTSPVPVEVESGGLCTPAQVTRAERVAMGSLRANFRIGTDIDRTKATVDRDVRAAFGGARCRGLEYAGEQARLVYAGVMPVERLMPDAR